MRRLIAGFMLSATFVCSYANAEAVKNYVEIQKPPVNSNILATAPQVSLAELTASGTQDPKAEWSLNAKNFLWQAANDAIIAKKYRIVKSDPNEVENSRGIQILKLNEAVTTSIATNNFPIFKLPTKTSFDWTVGTGASELVSAELRDSTSDMPQYALFLSAKGSYSSGGRKTLMVGAMLMGASIPMGGQFVQASLIDLKTGQIVWYNSEAVALGTDIRTLEGAQSEIARLFKNLPL